jgi:hypothetical protein
MPGTLDPAVESNAGAVRERMISDLLAGERELRKQAEQVTADFRHLLYSLARQVAGETVQEILRRDPFAFQSWPPAQWQAFFEQVRKGSPAWGQGAKETVDEPDQPVEMERLRQSAAYWQGQAQGTQNRLEEALQHITELEAEIRQPRRASFQPLRPPDETPPDLPEPDASADLRTRLAYILHHWSVPHRPARFARQLSQEALQWRRQSMGLHLIARYGLNARIEIEHLVGTAEGLSSRSSSLRRTVELLVDNHLLEAETLRLLQPETSLALVRLTEDGRQLCSVLGWEPVESGWERLLRLKAPGWPKERLLEILIFAMHARLRGWDVQLLPEVAGAEPHLHVERGDINCYAWLVSGSALDVERWHSLPELPGQIGLCTATYLQRQQFTAPLRTLGRAVQVASLEELIAVRLPDINPAVELWLERYD